MSSISLYDQGVPHTASGITFEVQRQTPEELAAVQAATAAAAAPVLVARNLTPELNAANSTPPPRTPEFRSTTPLSQAPDISSDSSGSSSHNSGSTTPVPNEASDPIPYFDFDAETEQFNKKHLKALLDTCLTNAVDATRFLLQRNNLPDSTKRKIGRFRDEIQEMQKILGATEDISALNQIKEQFIQEQWLDNQGLEKNIDEFQDLILEKLPRLLESPPQPSQPTAFPSRDIEPINLAPGFNAVRISSQREDFNGKMRLRMFAAYVATIAFVILGATVNPYFFTAAWACFEYGNAALNAQEAKTFARGEIFRWSLFFRAADYFLCSMPRKHFTFTPPPAPLEETTGPSTSDAPTTSVLPAPAPGPSDVTDVTDIEVDLGEGQLDYSSSDLAQNPAESAPGSDPVATLPH